MKKALVIFIILLGMAGASFQKHSLYSDAHLRDRVFMLKGDTGQCTGVQVKAKSGKILILTAAHCRDLLNEQAEVLAIPEHGEASWVHFIAEDPNADLMLLSAANEDSIDVADKVAIHEHVHTMTHGGGKPSYRTDGEMSDEIFAQFEMFPIMGDEDYLKCGSMPKQQIVIDFPFMICAITAVDSRATAEIMPGSSGGPLVNDKNELVGIASAMGRGDYLFVRLVDIKSFLAVF